MSYFFKLPSTTELNPKQQTAINCPEPIALKGGPGTGKSVVTLYRHIINCDKPNHGYLLTYHVALCKYLQIAASKHKNNNTTPHSKNIITTSAFINSIFSKDMQQEIIFDETQDLDHSFYEIFKDCKVSYAIDGEQSTNIHHTYLEELQKKLNDWYQHNRQIILDKNYRNTKQIMTLVKSIFPTKIVPTEINETGPKPELIYSSGKNQLAAIVDIIRNNYGPNHNIGILLPTSPGVDTMYDTLQKEIPDIKVSKYHSKIDFHDIENVHITTYKSSKGLEFDTVILPDFDKSVLKKDGRLENENEIYVAFTRTKRNLVIFDNRPTKKNNIPLQFLSLAITNNILKVNNEYK